MSAGRQVVRNSLFGVASQMVGGALYFFVAILIARRLGPESYGPFAFVFAVVTVFQMLADFGLTNILVREIARAKDKVGEILGAVIPLVTLFAATGYGLIVVCAQFLRLDPATGQAMYLMGATVLVTFHAAVYGSVCRAFEEMGFNALGLILQRVLLLLLVIVALRLEAGLPGFALCYLGERVCQWLFFYGLVRTRYSRYVWRIDVRYWGYLIREGWPIGAGMVLRRLSWYVDTLLLAALSTPASVGLFSAAYRLIQMVNVIPFTLSLPVFPILARFAVESADRAFSGYLRALKMFVLIGLPIGLWLVALGPQVMILLFGAAYEPAGPALRILGLAVVLLFLNGLYVNLFSALGRQRLYLISIGVSIAVNVVLDLLWIPVYDILGAALASLLGEATLCLMGAMLLSRCGLVTPYSRLLVRPVLAAALAGTVLLWPACSNSVMSLITGSLGFTVLFLALSHRFGALNSDEIATILDLLPKRHAAAGRQAREQDLAL